MSRSAPHVLIIGGGIGGLAAAVALRRAGVRATVFERAPELLEIGAGLSLWPNAIRALERLDLAAPLTARGVPESDGGVRTWRGDPLFITSTHELERRYGARTLAVHRADLQATLVEALDPGALRLGAECVGFTQDAAGVTARFADGSESRGDALIGADGIRSIVRARLWGDPRPRYAGYTAWRAVVPFDHDHLPAGESWGCGRRFGIVPMSQDRVYWFATENAPEGTPAVTHSRKRHLAELFAGWHAPIPELIAATDEAAILHHDLYDLRPLRRWTRGRATLLGDAAHAMTPNLGQGACQAIEDAVVLGRCFADSSDPLIALRRYEERRRRRANAIARQSRWIGRIGQLERPLLCRLRDELFRRLSDRARMRQFDGLLGDHL
jgi:2-polyprenyl-6-methoxyphenol hydroxylase-like FAD-dependent oxidoreductase